MIESFTLRVWDHAHRYEICTKITVDAPSLAYIAATDRCRTCLSAYRIDHRVRATTAAREASEREGFGLSALPREQYILSTSTLPSDCFASTGRHATAKSGIL